MVKHLPYFIDLLGTNGIGSLVLSIIIFGKISKNGMHKTSIFSMENMGKALN